MTLRHAMAIGLVLGVTFSLAAMVADLLAQRRLPHHATFSDPADFIRSLRK